jgi:hypothetical protein
MDKLENNSNENLQEETCCCGNGGNCSSVQTAAPENVLADNDIQDFSLTEPKKKNPVNERLSKMLEDLHCLTEGKTLSDDSRFKYEVAAGYDESMNEKFTRHLDLGEEIEWQGAGSDEYRRLKDEWIKKGKERHDKKVLMNKQFSYNPNLSSRIDKSFHVQDTWDDGRRDEWLGWYLDHFSEKKKKAAK